MRTPHRQTTGCAVAHRTRAAESECYERRRRALERLQALANASSAKDDERYSYYDA